MRQNHRGRPALAAAAQIREKLAPAHPDASWLALPGEAWEQLVRVTRLLRVALEKEWHHAGQHLLVDLDYIARRVARETEKFAANLPNRLGSSHVAPASEMAADIVALEEDFQEVTIDQAEHTLSVVTEPITLEGTELGRFRIVLDWDAMHREVPYAIEALESHPAQSDSGIIHPHVREGSLCAGDGHLAIQASLKGGRILDFFTLIARVLATYNEGSAYVSLDRWSGVACQDCGHIMPSDDHSVCERCEDPLCGDCSLSCAHCGYEVCSRCLDQCVGCGDTYCRRCLTHDAHSSLCHCAECREQLLARDALPPPTDPTSTPDHQEPSDETSSPPETSGAAA